MSLSLPSAALEAHIAAHLPRSFPALSICALQRGELIWQQAWGWHDPVQRNIPTRCDSLFDLASVSKLITVSCFLALVERGTIALDSALADVLPSFAERGPVAIGCGQDPHTGEMMPIDARYQGQLVDPAAVQFRHLLTHCSGLPAWRSAYAHAAPCPPPVPQAGDSYAAERWQGGFAALLGYPFVAPVGSHVLYSDIGMMLLGAAVAKLHGTRFDRAAEELLLQPLELASFTHNPVAKGIPWQRMVPTEYDDKWRLRRVWGEVHDENSCGLGGVTGHAGYFATAADLARFGQAWLCGDERLPIGTMLRGTATQEQASGQFRLGLGWMLKARQGSSAGTAFSTDSYGHTGFTGTSLWIDPQRELVCACLSNRVYWGRERAGIHAFRATLHDLLAEAVDKR